MNNQSIQIIRNILEAMMTINVKGNDAITLVDCMRALQQVITIESASQTKPTAESENAE